MEAKQQEDVVADLRGRQTRRLLLFGFGGLLLLIAFTGLDAVSVIARIQNRNQTIRDDYVNRQRILEQLRSDIYLSGTYVRDFLLEPDATRADLHRRGLDGTRTEIMLLIAAYQRILRGEEQTAFQPFTREITAYFAELQPVLQWNAAQRRASGYDFMSNSLLPRRSLLVRLADQIGRLNQEQLEAGNQQVASLFHDFRRSLLVFVGLMLAGGLTLAAASFYRIVRLEDLSGRHLAEVLQARTALRDLSARLVEAQEAERRSLSRELHDEVGQAVSALLLAIGNVAAAISPDTIEEAKEQLQEIRRVAERTVAVVRDMSLLLRPSMLDDLGLIPALEWQAREVSRTNNVRVTIESAMAEDELPDEQRTCIYRVVQEALRNVIRHAKAKNVRVTVEQDAGALHLVIEDDGQGFLPEREKGVGLLGMEERVRHLNGSFQLVSQPGRGTTIRVELPRGPMEKV
jgi:signal transduction histidine kinase